MTCELQHARAAARAHLYALQGLQERSMMHDHASCSCTLSFSRCPAALACSNLSDTLSEFWIDNNDFEGNLYMLGPTKVAWALVRAGLTETLNEGTCLLKLFRRLQVSFQ
jgi:hypothetical protein